MRSLLAQSPCQVPPQCIVNNELGAPAPSGDLNTSANNTVNGWYVSHGTPTLFGNDAPSNANGCSIWMWSYYGNGEGVFTCFDFQPGTTYEVCFWVRNTNIITADGHLQIWMVNNYSQYQNGGSLPPQNITGELIDSSFVNDQVWTQLSFSVTPSATFNGLLIYPYMAGPPINNMQYELQIDDVRVSSGAVITGPLTISADPSAIELCDSSLLCVSGLPPGSSVTWSPSAGLIDTTGICVVAAPCATTTYTATLDLGAACPNACGMVQGDTTLSVQVIVDPPEVEAFSNSPLICGRKLVLWVVREDTICTADGQWVAPNGELLQGDSAVVPDAGADDLGTYTYQVLSSSGGCALDAATVHVGATGTDGDFFVPNAFSPNGDGSNDDFVGVSAGIESYEMRVFDRWGELIHESSSPTSAWNGDYGGTMVQNGVYVYVVDYKLECSTEAQHCIGHVTVLQ